MAFWRFEFLGGRGDRSDDEEEERGLLEEENGSSEGICVVIKVTVCCEPFLIQWANSTVHLISYP